MPVPVPGCVGQQFCCHCLQSALSVVKIAKCLPSSCSYTDLEHLQLPKGHMDFIDHAKKNPGTFLKTLVDPHTNSPIKNHISIVKVSVARG